MHTGQGVHVDDEVLWRANGTSFPAEYWCYPQWKGQEVVGAVVAFFDITARKLAEAALASVSGKLIEAQEQERRRIARELHDDLGQRLAMLAIELAQLQQRSSNPSEFPEHIGKLQQQTSEIAADIQSLSHRLHSSRLQYLGLPAALRGFCREFSEQQKVEVDFETYDMPAPLSSDVSLCFFRVLQEALYNAAKHSGVRHFEVRLWGTPDEIHLTIRDSGVGFDIEAAKAGPGFGLISMQERLKLLNGALSVESQLERGTTIHASVPHRSDARPTQVIGQ
jgi:signal transduction histidine kinase